MNDINKDDAQRSRTPGQQRSGSDTASAANISAGTSVGNAGQPATPYGQQGAGGGAGGTGGAYGQPGGGSAGGSTSVGQQGAGGGGGGSGSSYGQPGGGSSSAGGLGGSTYGQQGGVGSSGQGSGSANWASRAASDATRHAGGSTGGMHGESGGDHGAERTREQYRQGARQLYQARNKSMGQLRSARGGVEHFVTENPLMVGVMGLAAGLVIGALLPRTRQEDRAFGRWADEVREQGYRYARDATQRGREYVEEALGGADSDEDDWRPEEESRGSIRSSGPRYQNH